MEFSSFFFHLLFLCLIFQLSNTIVSSTKVEISAQNAHTDKLDSLTEQMDADIGKGLVQQRIKRDTDDEDIPRELVYISDTDDENIPEDVLYVDHRESNCLAAPRSQDNCPASYAFAIIAFYEWLNCMKTGEFEAFSEQYLVDCGYRHGNSGCNGGNVETAAMFVDACGLLLQKYYPYMGIQKRCVYDDSISDENMGALRVIEQSVTFIPLDQQSLEQHLEVGPIVVTIEISYRFILYPGGVDDNVGHTPELLHTMLLIGYGRENGVDYWLFRNSLHTVGGEGHYKLNKNVDCLRGGSGLGVNRPILG